MQHSTHVACNVALCTDDESYARALFNYDLEQQRQRVALVASDALEAQALQAQEHNEHVERKRKIAEMQVRDAALATTLQSPKPCNTRSKKKERKAKRKKDSKKACIATTTVSASMVGTASIAPTVTQPLSVNPMVIARQSLCALIQKASDIECHVCNISFHDLLSIHVHVDPDKLLGFPCCCASIAATNHVKASALCTLCRVKHTHMTIAHRESQKHNNAPTLKTFHCPICMGRTRKWVPITWILSQQWAQTAY